jgi:universal stress protein A
MNATHTILFPTDFTGKWELVFGLACSIARDRGARLMPLHVVPRKPMQVPQTPLDRERAQHAEEDLGFYRRSMTEKLHSLRDLAKGIMAEPLLKEGEPAAVICQTAQHLGCDLIVMEAPAKSGATRPVLGSVLAEVLREAPCPVVMLRSPAS